MTDKIKCRITYANYSASCGLYKTKEQNRDGAWKILVKMLKEHNQEIPTLDDFIECDGTIEYYGGEDD